MILSEQAEHLTRIQQNVKVFADKIATYNEERKRQHEHLMGVVEAKSKMSEEKALFEKTEVKERINALEL